VYVDRLAELKKRGDPVAARTREASTRPEAFDVFAQTMVHVQKFVEKVKAKDELYSHISEEDVGKVEKLLMEKQAWYQSQFSLCMNLKKTSDPPILTQQINNEREVSHARS